MIKRIFILCIPILCFVALVLFLSGYNDSHTGSLQLREFLIYFKDNMKVVAELKIPKITWRCEYLQNAERVDSFGDGILEVLKSIANFFINLFNTLILVFNVAFYIVNLLIVILGAVVSITASLFQWVASTGVNPALF